MQQSTREKLRRLKEAPAILGWFLILKPLIQFLLSMSDIDFFVSAPENPRMIAVLNFFATPQGNVILIALGFLWLGYLVVKPESNARATKAVKEISAKEQPRIEDKPPNSPSKRVFVDVTPEYLWGVFKEHTEAQALKLIEVYIGKWLKVSGTVDDVRADTWAVHIFLRGPLTGVISLHSNEQEWINRVSVLRRGDRITALGQISRIERMSLWLDNCEVIDSKSTADTRD